MCAPVVAALPAIAKTAAVAYGTGKALDTVGAFFNRGKATATNTLGAEQELARLKRENPLRMVNPATIGGAALASGTQQTAPLPEARASAVTTGGNRATVGDTGPSKVKSSASGKLARGVVRRGLRGLRIDLGQTASALGNNLNYGK
tara:strand:- start:1012 stop:1452 length:441 start_codon:yes stop_codon:yes gene_type:complete